MFEPRQYQQEAVDAVIAHISKSKEPCLVEAATGAGKSLIISMVANWINEKSGKYILCIAPSKELVEQNYEKYLNYGDASIFCASVGKKCLKHHVVFCSPMTAHNAIDEIANLGIAAVIIDECHGITPTIRKIIGDIRANNVNLRVIGMTATPYRMNTGHIYRVGLNNERMAARDPFFSKLVFSIGAKSLIDQNFLSPPVFPSDETETPGYSTLELEVQKNGRFEQSEMESVTTEDHEKTAAIIADVVFKSANRHGVMIFATSIKHAMEINSLLPPGLSAIITGTDKKKDREAKIAAFKNKSIKYLVNVSCLTTGFDAPHVDVIAILRPTESAGLWQQIMGRGLRIDEGKSDCLVLDYANNIIRHGLKSDLFSPEILVKKPSGNATLIDVECPFGHVSQFVMKKDFVGITEEQITTLKIDHDGHVPSFIHYGRRCNGQVAKIKNPLLDSDFERCGHFFTPKICACGVENDITARVCRSCKAELINPDDKLNFSATSTRLERVQVISFEENKPKISKNNNRYIRVEFKTEEFGLISDFFFPDSRHLYAIKRWHEYRKARIFGNKIILEVALIDGDFHKVKRVLAGPAYS